MLENKPYNGGFPSRTIYIYPQNQDGSGFSDVPLVHTGGGQLYRNMSELKQDENSLILYLLNMNDFKSGAYMMESVYEDWELMEEYPSRLVIINLEEWEVTWI